MVVHTEQSLFKVFLPTDGKHLHCVSCWDCWHAWPRETSLILLGCPLNDVHTSLFHYCFFSLCVFSLLLFVGQAYGLSAAIKLASLVYYFWVNFTFGKFISFALDYKVISAICMDFIKCVFFAYWSSW